MPGTSIDGGVAFVPISPRVGGMASVIGNPRERSMAFMPGIHRDEGVASVPVSPWEGSMIFLPVSLSVCSPSVVSVQVPVAYLYLLNT